MNAEIPRTCYRESNGVRFTKNAHRPDCDDGQCRGCQRCPEPRHCTARTNCNWHVAHGELTCGRCVRAARTDLRWIALLSSLMLPAAIAEGVDSEAANLAGPAVDPTAWSQRRLAMVGHLDHWLGTERISERQYVHARIAMEDDDEFHPLRVLGIWEQMIREDYDQPAAGPTSVTSAAGYLDRQLHRIAHDDEQDFPLLARELRKCRQHLEVVLHNDDKPERGAPCPECTNEETGVGPRLVRKFAHWCDDEDCERLHFRDEAGDVWLCPANRDHWWNPKGYADLLKQRRAGRKVSA